MSLRLILPSRRYKGSYLSALREFAKESAHPQRLREEAACFDDYLRYWRRLSRGLVAGIVPLTTYWLVDGPRYLGMVQIRHVPSGRHPSIKSHLYYEIRPSARRHGYGTALLRLSLPKARRLGIRQLLIACDRRNTASRAVIERNGGVLEKEVRMLDGAVMHRYRISLDRSATTLLRTARRRPR